MKNIFVFALFTLSLFSATSTYAQTDENRIKIQLTVPFKGKNIITDLNGITTSLSRTYEDTPAIKSDRDSTLSKIAGYNPAPLYLTMDAKKINEELLSVFAKKQNKFDGTITIVDTYGKNPTRIIKFKQASLYSYTDNVAAGGYGETYGSAAISISCQEVSVNGIIIEQ
ncbi:hypothetical protein A0256_22365 [Mucilaginibacter sp. PAMC 26640]|nr:hypothetical protein A0256_22365 [Mucilaginibacter sp. PAMC 26640]